MESIESGEDVGGPVHRADRRLGEAFTASVDFDRRLYRQDVAGSVAHATMLAEVGVIDEADREAIVAGLREIEADIESGRFEWSSSLEDVHMNIEAALTERIGEAGKKLHTARSRNDQVATDLRLYVRAETDAIVEALRRLRGTVLDLADREADTVMPGFTHLQAAQPITFGHHVLAWHAMLERDAGRFATCGAGSTACPSARRPSRVRASPSIRGSPPGCSASTAPARTRSMR